MFRGVGVGESLGRSTSISVGSSIFDKASQSQVQAADVAGRVFVARRSQVVAKDKEQNLSSIPDTSTHTEDVIDRRNNPYNIPNKEMLQLKQSKQQDKGAGPPRPDDASLQSCLHLHTPLISSSLERCAAKPRSVSCLAGMNTDARQSTAH